jgi:exopolysaccharide production protein ExoY
MMIKPTSALENSGMAGEPSSEPGSHRLPRYEHRFYRVMKRIFDIILATVALIVLFPVFVLIAILVVSSDGGPILFKHRRYGLGGKPFYIYKFRSMRKDAEQILERDPALKEQFLKGFKLDHDPRLIRFGKFLRSTSLDELPQFINILKGEMSVVGPRPIMDGEQERYGATYETYKAMIPGCAGLWQCNGRSQVDYEDRIKYTEEYYHYASLRRDVLILWRTIVAVLRRDGAQ